MRPQLFTKGLQFAICSISAFALLNVTNASDLTIPRAHELDSIRAKRLPPDEENKIAELEQAVRLHPADAPILVRAAILSATVKPVTFAGVAVGAALNALGDSIDSLSVGRLVNAAGKARPEAILEIVRIAIRETPHRLHRDVVAAAATAVPDPYAHVHARRVESEALAGNAGGVHRQDFGKAVVDGKDFGKSIVDEKRGPEQGIGDDAVGFDPGQDTEPTLAESILEVAVDSGGDNYADLAGALNESLIALFPQPPDHPIVDPPGRVPPVSP